MKPKAVTQEPKWERDPRWWWGWRDGFTFGIRWREWDFLHIRGIVLGPIAFYWEKWAPAEAGVAQREGE